MSIDPSTLSPDTVVEYESCLGWYPTYVSRLGGLKSEGLTIIRTFSPDPLPSQEVPRDKWATIRPGSRVRVEHAQGDIFLATIPSHKDDRGAWIASGYYVSWQAVDRVFLLDEPADPDADLIERIASALRPWSHDDEGNKEARLKQARAALAVVRESEAGA